MKKIILVLVAVAWGFSCSSPVQKELLSGAWHAEMQVADSLWLPVDLVVSKTANEKYVLQIKNAEEVIDVDEITIQGDSIWIKMPVFEGYIVGTFTDSTIVGSFNKESLERYVPVIAKYGEYPRFAVNKKPDFDVSGIWETEFDFDTDGPYPAKGIFAQTGDKVTGTFRTKTGDYRYLEGVMDGDSLKLSTFDGAHVFLFAAAVKDSSMQGTFYSGNHAVENFIAKRNAAFELPDANTLTYLKEGYTTFDFSFPDENGNIVSLSDESFQNKVVLVQIMGTWCPNCLDETKFYRDYLKKNPNADLEIVALAFEYAKTEEKAFTGIRRLRERVGVGYPILLAQTGTSSKSKANEKLPMLNHVLSYPTTIYIDKKGGVRKIHTGFNGPATGEKHEEFKKDFAATLQELLQE
ncbi:MAG: TlpA disulfide reductase family protein [Bacteroidota bacterium]